MGTLGIKINSVRLVRVLIIIGIILLVLSTAGYVSRFYLGHRSALIGGFSFGEEKNFPTYFAAMLFLFCAALSAFVAVPAVRQREKYARHWAFLSAVFVYCSVDEMLEIHEKLIRPVRALLHTKGIFYFAWVIPFGILLVIFLLAYLGFLKHLPKDSRARLVAAGAIYVLGAMGMEMLGSRYAALHGTKNFIYAMHQTVEESLEIGGLILCVDMLATYIRDHLKSVSLDFE